MCRMICVGRYAQGTVHGQSVMGTLNRVVYIGAVCAGHCVQGTMYRGTMYRGGMCRALCIGHYVWGTMYRDNMSRASCIWQYVAIASDTDISNRHMRRRVCGH